MGFLKGKQLLPREFAAYAHARWPGDELPKAVAVALSESALYCGAYNDNMTGASEHVTSRDCGVFQINIDAKDIGSTLEFTYRSESMEEQYWDQVVKNSVAKARTMYDSPWMRNGKQDIRRWQAWYGYTNGWATFPSSWIWHQTAGVPTGPWLKTGRYIHKSIVGIANYHVLVAKDKTLAEAVSWAETQADRFKLDSKITSRSNLVTFIPPPMPTVPPKDGVGPRPKVNDGV